MRYKISAGAAPTAGVLGDKRKINIIFAQKIIRLAKKRKQKQTGVLKTVRKILLRCIAAFFMTSILSAILLIWLPVKYTPLMFIRFIENIENDGYRTVREWKSIDEISEHMIRAVLASEDANFMYHCGFDFDAIKKAMEYNRRTGKKYGASTITQQTAKNVYLVPSRSWIRKGFEAYFTFLIEFLWSKKRIIEVYMNIIEVGDGLYGVEAAAQAYFKKAAKELSAFEACQIASILPNPREFKILNPSRELKARQSRIRKSMDYIKWEIP